jgi:hypothetical protein
VNVERRVCLNQILRDVQGFSQNTGLKALLLAMIWKWKV